MKLLYVAVVALLGLSAVEVSAKDDKECEVCIKVIDTLKAQYTDLLKESKGKPKLDVAEVALEKMCTKFKSSPKEKKLVRPTRMVLSLRVRSIDVWCDTLKICQSLTKKNPEFCSIRFPIKTEAGADYSKLRVKELKKILSERGVSCNGCVEKSDFVKKLQVTEHIEL
ncbi:hypothetical protein DYB25_008148 [Aphanomyces astaci]|uniref:Mesencephalic astrocyte-derived neurotrophic factor homolog n=1 Tax=Aphanomyces astaci TaxID=112090 RepID=A0A397E8J7_APHAT|nr:hypothetical protein DYB36_011633 [Aphanomyces astaci]RHY22486.1 hypothetical protein DYB25_008148 [Aphanomyces astaci]RHY52655.1 hypothetical protein DYB34_004437 [Aphanomyces astaci]RHY77560.1 hypothetical protein DYB38_004536 [Aphanomyces astaci]RHZ06521.1 hypothetical protein DYB31_003737 [Aphanomyces astaci]